MIYAGWELSASYVDTCQACCLLDGHTRGGEMLLYTVPYCQMPIEALDELMDSWIDELPQPTIPDEGWAQVLLPVLEQIDWRAIDSRGNRIESIGADDCCCDYYDEHDDPPNVYVVIKWRKI